MVARFLIAALGLSCLMFGQYSPPAGGGGSIPAGSSTQVQYNTSGAFDASSALTFTANGLLSTRTIGAGNQGFTDPLVNPLDPGTPYTSGLNAWTSLTSVPKGDRGGYEVAGASVRIEENGATGNLTDGVMYGAKVDTAIGSSNSATQGEVTGINSLVTNSGSGNISLMNGIQAYALNAAASAATILGIAAYAESSAGTTGLAYGFETQVRASATGTITSAAGMHIESTTKASGATLTANHGLKIENQTAGATNYAIKTGTGQVVFGDTVKATGYLSSDGSVGATVSACTSFKNGLCVAGTEPEPEPLAARVDRLEGIIADLRAQLAALAIQR